ncbi:hypothetical protein WICMUC_000127 [Wickerhamomyces mucosus]|uniref:EVE domain-containing protein n=1 Tax=Wickerhamomyces mucosus TaxID=1378264 RepID=A0A9P8TJ59_9ASCO|nr:hypothetical protein WICMUC_000127 [Wickerhamomyces mucosus]
MPVKKVVKKKKNESATKADITKIESKINEDIESDNNKITKPTPKKPAEFEKDLNNNNTRYWLIKSEPLSRIDPVTKKDVKFPFSDLLEVEYEEWNGVRNYEARNNMLNMEKEDILLFYHSNTPSPGIVGLAKVANEAHPDSLQFNSKSNYYDSRSNKEAPKWWCVDVKFYRRFRSKITLQELRENESLVNMSLVKRGRLSVTPVRKEEYYEILKMESKKNISNNIDCEMDEKYIDP